MLRHAFATLLLANMAAGASANQPANITDGELAVLPAYCQDVQGIRYGDASSNTSPRASYWVAQMGKGFWAMHHYCWARINMRRSQGLGVKPSEREHLLGTAIADLFYVVDKTPKGFVLLPEIYSTLAEVELMRKNPAGALGYVETARKLKPDYAPPYVLWSSHLVSVGKKSEARDFLKSGLEVNSSNPSLRSLYLQLGGNLSAIAPEAPASSPVNTTPSQAVAPRSAASAASSP